MVHPIPLQLLGPSNRIVALDAATKTLSLQSGDKVVYESLISTMPLDLTLSWLGKQEWADGLTHRCAPPPGSCAGMRCAVQGLPAHITYRV